MYHIENGKLIDYCGDYDYFKNKCLQLQNDGQPVKRKTSEKAKKPVKAAAAVQKEDPKAMLAKRIEAFEEAIDGIKQEMNSLENASDYTLLQALHESLSDKEAELEAAYEEWYRQG